MDLPVKVTDYQYVDVEVKENDIKVQVFLEIEKGSNIKYELNKTTNQLEVDRILPEPYVYPYPYGFIPNTTNVFGIDDDELDALIITDNKLETSKYYDVYIIGVLIMDDECGLDEKILCVLEEDYQTIKNIGNLSLSARDSIETFFTNYKKNTEGKWSNVHNFASKDCASFIYNRNRIYSDDEPGAQEHNAYLQREKDATKSRYAAQPPPPPTA
jgi:inorganic pyrophosphatase